MLIIISSLLLRFATFDSLVLLKTLGYDIALSVREAQSYSLSVLGTEIGTKTEFRKPYGVSFTPAADEYVLFVFPGTESERPKYDGGSSSVVKTYALGRSFVILDVCVKRGATNDCNISRLDIAFRRPEFISLFSVPTYTESLNASIDEATILVGTTADGAKAKITVGYTGQIVVSLEE